MKRLDHIDEMWEEFVESDTHRMLRWLHAPEDRAMIDAFLERESDETGTIPDFFLQFTEPFGDPYSFGATLVESLAAQYEASRQELADMGIPADWVAPEAQPGPLNVTAFARCAVSFHECFSEVIDLLVLVIIPSEISDPAHFQQWLHVLVRSELPPTIRILIPDPAESPMLNPLCEAEPGLIMTQAMDLDMPGARQEIADAAIPPPPPAPPAAAVAPAGSSPAAADTPTAAEPLPEPGPLFRSHFVAMTNASAKSDIKATEAAAASALAIATTHNWSAMQVVVHTALGNTYLGAGNIDQALASYRSGRGSAARAAEQGDPSAPKLDIQTRLGEATAYFSIPDHLRAATLYEETALVAEGQEDHFMTLECWRMAAICREELKEFDIAWEHSLQAIDAGAKLDDATRPNVTLPWVGQLMLRLTRKSPYTEMEPSVRERMIELVGPDWEDRLEGNAPSTPSEENQP